MTNTTWFVYIIEADDCSFYTGITTHIPTRFQTHLHKKGAKYFYARRPVCVRYVEICCDKSVAAKREYAIKKLTRTQKLQLIEKWEHDAPSVPIR